MDQHSIFLINKELKQDRRRMRNRFIALAALIILQGVVGRF